MPAVTLAQQTVVAVGDHQRDHATAHICKVEDAVFLQWQQQKPRRLMVGIQLAALGQLTAYVVARLVFPFCQLQGWTAVISLGQREELGAAFVGSGDEISPFGCSVERDHCPS